MIIRVNNHDYCVILFCYFPYFQQEGEGDRVSGIIFVRNLTRRCLRVRVSGMLLIIVIIVLIVTHKIECRIEVGHGDRGLP